MLPFIQCDECTIAKYDPEQEMDKYFCPILKMFVVGYGECDPVHMIGLVFARLLKLEEKVERNLRRTRPMR